MYVALLLRALYTIVVVDVQPDPRDEVNNVPGRGLLWCSMSPAKKGIFIFMLGIGINWG